MAILSESLRRLQVDSLSVGEPFLDQSLASIHQDAELRRSPAAALGIPSRSCTEISGPPGSGKTAIWLGLALEALKRGLNVLYVTCDFTPFPMTRARSLPKWNSARYEPRICELNVSSMKNYLLLDTLVDVADYGLVIIDHYEKLVRLSWDRDTRGRASEALLRKASVLAQKSCIVATTGCIKYQNEENCPLLAPFTIGARIRPLNMVRVSLYKDFEGNCVLSTGVKFRVGANGVLTAADALSAPVLPIYGLSSKRRPTPDRLAGSQMMTPSSLPKKRRLSQSTPVKAHAFRSGSPRPALSESELNNGYGLLERQVSPRTTATPTTASDDNGATRLEQSATDC